jgi:hypothetical protein
VRRTLRWKPFGYELEIAFVVQTLGWLVVVLLLCYIGWQNKLGAQYENQTSASVSGLVQSTQKTLDVMSVELEKLRDRRREHDKRLQEIEIQVEAVGKALHAKMAP